MQVETGRGVLTLALKINAKNKVEQVTVNMGEPILDLPKIPVEVRATPASPGLRQVGPHDYELPIDEARARQASPLRQVYVSMGNPHSVAFVPDVARVELERIGPIVEHHKAYPRRINAHWAQVISRNEVRMRTWERGSGITWACGTGACAVLVAGVLTGRTDRKALVHLPGGDLTIEWRESDNNVYMTGPATEVFSGEWNDAG